VQFATKINLYLYFKEPTKKFASFDTNEAYIMKKNEFDPYMVNDPKGLTTIK
jgi:hypothetical protein